MRYFISLLAVLAIFTSCNKNKTTTSTETYLEAPSFCEDSAYAYIAAQCSFGPRTMGSAAHDSCGDYIAAKFESFGAKVYNQYADSKLYDGTPIKMRNIIASMNPDAPTRIIISGHWDSRPWADHDEDEGLHHTPIDGANDGGSSIGVMLEMARQIQKDIAENGDSAFFAFNPAIGIDFICWDAEDCGTPSFADAEEENSASTWCLGSQYWAGVRHIEGYSARWGVNLDMVGSSNTIFCKERYSLYYAQVYVDRIWKTAQRLGYDNYFKDETCGYVTDDHVQVNYSGIPCVDIIGADNEGVGFPSTWHTSNDNITNISKQTLKAVGETMMNVIWNER